MEKVNTERKTFATTFWLTEESIDQLREATGSDVKADWARMVMIAIEQFDTLECEQ